MEIRVVETNFGIRCRITGRLYGSSIGLLTTEPE